MNNLIIYPTPLESRCQLQHDAGWSVDAVTGYDTNGRPCQVFTIPSETHNRWGARLVITADKKISFMNRGLLVKDLDNWVFYLDDVTLADVPPPVIVEVPIPPPVIPPPAANDPLSIIKSVYATGLYNLTTMEGCGKFTEACCVELHNRNSLWWGHIKKVPPQTMYNGHAVDALQVLYDVGETQQGIYDIIISKASPNARPAFNRQGDAVPSLWYYPA